jgi:hypothetical protein
VSKRGGDVSYIMVLGLYSYPALGETLEPIWEPISCVVLYHSRLSLFSCGRNHRLFTAMHCVLFHVMCHQALTPWTLWLYKSERDQQEITIILLKMEVKIYFSIHGFCGT